MLIVKAPKNQVLFKSISPYYEKEENGTKPNTVRDLEIGDDRLSKLILWQNNNDRPLGTIRIMHKHTYNYFDREITDITFWQGLAIISWKHTQITSERKDGNL